MPDIGKAYVQIIPSADGMQGSLESLLSGPSAAAGLSAGRAAGLGFSGGFGKVAAWLGIAAAAKKGVDFLKDSMQLGMEFDAAMSQVAATMGTTVDQIEELRDAARESGRTTRYTAEQSAQALNYMALAGYDANTSMQMMPTVLDLAAAGNMDLALASDMVTDSQSALNLSLSGTTRLVDQMARASSRSNTSVAQLGEAILTVGGNANFMKGGTAELATVLGILADNGIKGAEGGTHLRNMLLSLSDPTKDARDMMERLGVSIFDADGNMRSFAEFFPELKQAISGLNGEEQMQALSAIFNTRDMAAAQALMSTEIERWNELIGEMNDSAGAARQMAETQLDNLQGDLTVLKNSWADVKITVSEALDPFAREVVGAASDALDLINLLFDEFNSEPPKLKTRSAAEVQAMRDEFNTIPGKIGEILGYLPGISEQGATNAVQGFFNKYTMTADQRAEGVKTAFQTFAGNIGTTFGTALGNQSGPVSAKAQAMADAAKKHPEALQQQSGSWGIHMGFNFGSGLLSQLSFVSAAANALARAAAGPLKHSVPEVGPLSDDDVWGAHMIQNLIGGMEREAPNLRATTDRMAGIVRDGMQFDNGVLRADVRGTAGAAGGYDSGDVVAEIRDLKRAMLNMKVVLEDGTIAGRVNELLGQQRADEVRRML